MSDYNAFTLVFVVFTGMWLATGWILSRAIWTGKFWAPWGDVERTSNPVLHWFLLLCGALPFVGYAIALPILLVGLVAR